jgi:large subunit ribosomal protein L25
MATVNLIKAAARSRAGKGAARAERRAGRVPGIIYGDGKPPLPISLDYSDLQQRIYAGHFLTTIHDVEIDGEKHRVIPRDFQLDAVRDLPLHVDFMRLGENATIRVNIPIYVRNSEQSPGVKRGGTVSIVTHTIEVRCRADAIPPGIDVDVSELDINHSRHLSDVKLPEGVRVVGQKDVTMVTVVPPSGYAEEIKAQAEALRPLPRLPPPLLVCLRKEPLAPLPARPLVRRPVLVLLPVQPQVRLRLRPVEHRRRSEAAAFVEHDLFGKPVSTFPDHALAG